MTTETTELFTRSTDVEIGDVIKWYVLGIGLRVGTVLKKANFKPGLNVTLTVLTEDRITYAVYSWHESAMIIAHEDSR